MIKNDSNTWFPESNNGNVNKEPLKIVAPINFCTISIERALDCPVAMVDNACGILCMQFKLDLSDPMDNILLMAVLGRSVMLN